MLRICCFDSANSEAKPLTTNTVGVAATSATCERWILDLKTGQSVHSIAVNEAQVIEISESVSRGKRNLWSSRDKDIKVTPLKSRSYGRHQLSQKERQELLLVICIAELEVISYISNICI